MLTVFARLATRRSRLVLATAVLFVVLAGVLGGGVARQLTTGGFDDPGSESSRAEQILADQFDTGTPNLLLVVTAKNGDVDDPAVVERGTRIARDLAATGDIDDVVSYWTENNAAPLRSDDGSHALVVARIDIEDEDVLNERIAELAPRLRMEDDTISVDVGGYAEVFREIGEVIEDDLLRAEMIALPITLVLLVLIFGSIVAATLPLAVGALSVVGTLLVLRMLVEVTDVSIYALNLTTAMGLGLAIDYSLFIVSRYREELREQPDQPRVAVVRTVRTAGRTVGFSALTVAASLCATLVFPFVFLRSFAYAGVVVAILAGLFSVVVLPALLAVLGHRVNALTLWRRSVTPPAEGVWHRIATFVMRRPIPVATIVVALVLFLGAPFLGLRLALPDDRVLPESAESAEAHDILRDEFTSEEASALSVVAPTTSASPEAGDSGGQSVRARIDDYATRLARLPGVSRVDAATGSYCGAGLAGQFGCEPGQLVLPPDSSPRYQGFSAGGGTYLSVVPDVEPLSSEGEQLVHDVRGTPSPFPVLVTGDPAVHVDSNAAMFGRLPYALAIVAVVTAVLLFMMFGSVLIPVKAIVLNLLSLSATFGAMVWIFQEGHLAELLDIRATGALAASMPVLMFCVAFGLSMDYEVFLLSRIKEEHDSGADNRASVAMGLERTGRIVTAAALLISVVFIAFATSRVSFLKMFGIGLTLAVLLDAFIIRGTLVPAFMRLAGDWNWWAPKPLRRIYERWGISEHIDLDDGAGGSAAAHGETSDEEAIAYGHDPG